jgi:V8-like Glu-specific endopeptidase
MMPSLRALAGPLALAVLVPCALAQTNPAPSNKVAIPIDTGYATNPSLETQTVLAFHVYEPGAAWLRLYFSDIELAGDPARGTGSILRITSLLDGYYQTLDAISAAQWQNSSAYFNGDLLLVEVIAQPGTGGNRIVLDSADVGLVPAGADTICGSTDDRVLSSDPRCARVLPIGCTSWIIDDACGCMLTAGHCSSGTTTIQFNVPLSNPNGSLNNPPPSDQYAVDPASKQSNGGQGVGNDWAYFGCFPNSNTGLTPRQAQGASFTLAPPPPWNSSLEARITGYGTDSGTSNQVQQTHKGPWLSYTSGSTTLSYQADTQGGNSGSPVIQEQSGIGMGIHTHGGCTVSGGSNFGTASVHPGLQAALAAPKGVCFKAVCPAALVTTRTMSPNLNVYTATAPVIGQTSTFTVNTSGFQFAQILGVGTSATRRLDNGFFALINVDSQILLNLGPLAGPTAMTTQVVTNDPSMCGVTVYSQARLFNTGGGSALTNAQDLRIGN